MDQEQGYAPGSSLPPPLMITNTTTQELIAALEAVLDCWLDGRSEGLDERERAAFDRANAAIAAATTSHVVQA